MSVYSVRAFMGRISEDQISRARLESRLEAGAGEAEVLVEFAAELGYEFSAGEFEEVLRQRHRDRRLAEHELDAVTGGVAGGRDRPVFLFDEETGWSLAPRPLRAR